MMEARMTPTSSVGRRTEMTGMPRKIQMATVMMAKQTPQAAVRMKKK